MENDLLNGKPMLTRVLQLHQGTLEEREVVVNIWPPRSEGPDFRCEFTIDGLPEPVKCKVGGIDALQAVEVAIKGAKKYLDPYRKQLSFLGVRGQHGMPFMLPLLPHPEANAYLERLIENEVQNFFDIGTWWLTRRKVNDAGGPPECD